MSKLLFLRSAIHMKPMQAVEMVMFRLRKPRPGTDALPAPRGGQGPWISEPPTLPAFLGGDRWRFLNRKETVPPGPWRLPGVPTLWNYNLNYFDHLFQPGLDAATARDHIARWVRENPPFGGPAWRPYPLSLRIVNWIRHAWSGQPLPAEAVASLAHQLRYQALRIEWFLRSNHTWTNGKALLFGGLFFEGPEALRWLETGVRIFRDELRGETLADGGNFERSPMYHSILLKDQLDLLNALQACRDTVPTLPPRHRESLEALRREILALLPPQFAWLAAMQHPDGDVSFFNDSATGIALPGAKLGGLARSLGVEVKLGSVPGLTLLRDTGFFRFEAPRYVCLGDVGSVGPDHQPGHAHAGTLSMELSVDSRRVLVNTGTSTYTEHPRRGIERSTAAHNTVVVDDKDSSEVWRDHRVARRAHVTGLTSTPDSIRAKHDGYRRLPGVRDVSRTWDFAADAIEVLDKLEGSGTHTVDIWFHFHPDCAVRIEGSTATTDRLQLELPPGLQVVLLDYEYAPRFGVRQPAKAVRARYNGPLPAEFITRISVR